ncbi:MAG: AgmX/PglI C-terminal domain-containing protein, partial [Acidobacteriota bacterium]
RDEARKCYDQGLEAKAGMGGKIFINFVIDPAGHVTETSQGMQQDQITQQEVVDCVRKVVEKITFAKSPSGKSTRAYHRFEFAGQ